PHPGGAVGDVVHALRAWEASRAERVDDIPNRGPPSFHRTEQAYNIMGLSKKDPPFPGFPVYSPERTFSPREPYVNNGRGETGSIGGVRKNHGHLRPRILPSRRVWIPEVVHRAGPGLEVAHPYQRDSLRRPAGHPAGEPRGRLRPGPR